MTPLRSCCKEGTPTSSLIETDSLRSMGHSGMKLSGAFMPSYFNPCPAEDGVRHEDVSRRGLVLRCCVDNLSRAPVEPSASELLAGDRNVSVLALKVEGPEMKGEPP